jgi:outer membrane protein assembly factor BamE (lipoprotein component of BamABCDE complex)
LIKFSKDGKVIEVDEVSLEQGREIKHVERKTPTHGNELTVLEQLIGNLGRFKKKQGSKPLEEPYEP